MKNYFRGSSAGKRIAYSVSMERHRVSQNWFIETKRKILCLAEIITLCLYYFLRLYEITVVE
jgi:hypothetical protein